MPSNFDYDDFHLFDRKGSIYDISLIRAQADTVIRKHLNLTIQSLEYIDTGYNNQIFFIDTVENAERYVLKIGGRYWVSSKTEDEVKSLQLLAQYTTIPVPCILAYSVDPDNEFGVGWILMTRLPGESMSKICWNGCLSFNAIRSIITDLAEYVSQMHLNIPRMQQIGAFRLNGQIDKDSNGLGPWLTYEQFVHDRARIEIRTIQKHPVFASIKDTILHAIEEFEQLQFSSLENVPLVFSHGDLHVQNILISMNDPETPRITGIVDWEWAGSFPCSEEYFTSFNYFLHHESEAVRELFLDEFEKRGILTPRTIKHFSVMQKINRFITTLALWDIPTSANPDDPLVMKKVERIRSTVRSIICELKEDLHLTVRTECC